MAAYKTIRFTNERGNRIEVGSKPGSASDLIEFWLRGPNSETTNEITRKEAMALRNALDAALRE